MSLDEYRGVLSRRGGFFSSWTKYTYVIRENYLFEYKLGANPVSSEPLQMLDIRDSLIEDAALMTGKPASFAFHSSTGKSLFFMAPSVQDKQKWMQLLTSYAHPQQVQQVQQVQQQQQQQQQQQLPSSASFHSTTSKPEQGSALTVPVSDSASGRSDTLNAAELEAKMPILKFLESFTDAVIVGNINGFIVAVNSSAEKLFGYMKDEMTGEPLVSLMPEPYKSQHDGYLFRHEKFGSEKLIGKTRNLKGVRKNEQVFDLQISLGKLPAKGYYIATIRELTGAPVESAP